MNLEPQEVVVEIEDEEPVVEEVHEVIEIDLTEQTEVEKLTLYDIESLDFETAYNQLLDTLAEYEKLKKAVDNKAKELMRAQYLIDGRNKVEGKTFNMTLIPQSYRESFDMTKFKKEEPKLYEQLYSKYKKVTKVSDALRVNRKKERIE